MHRCVEHNTTTLKCEKNAPNRFTFDMLLHSNRSTKLYTYNKTLITEITCIKNNNIYRPKKLWVAVDKKGMSNESMQMLDMLGQFPTIIPFGGEPHNVWKTLVEARDGIEQIVLKTWYGNAMFDDEKFKLDNKLICNRPIHILIDDDVDVDNVYVDTMCENTTILRNKNEYVEKTFVLLKESSLLQDVIDFQEHIGFYSEIRIVYDKKMYLM